MNAILILILLAVFILPFSVKKVEHNLEIFLFSMGLLASIVSGVFSKHLVLHIFENKNMYIITFVVFAASIIFRMFKSKLSNFVNSILKHIPLKLFVFLAIVILGLASSMITAIVASLVLIEMIAPLNIERKNKIKILVVACFAIGLGAALTPVGEPLSTIVVSRLSESFNYIFSLIGIYIISGILVLGILGALFAEYNKGLVDDKSGEIIRVLPVDNDSDSETNKEIIIRTLKIFLFIFALELLGAGFKPIIDTYVIGFDNKLLFWGNMTSAVLDNATLAAAEISTKLSSMQIRNILLGLLTSGGMLIPGNIPNIITAHKFKIESSEWAKFGVPLGLVLMGIYYIILF